MKYLVFLAIKTRDLIFGAFSTNTVLLTGFVTQRPVFNYTSNSLITSKKV